MVFRMASDATIDAILDAAERLFAARGYDAVSVREITREAGVNVAAVHYHFGSKEAVLRGVADRFVDSLNARRAELLDALLRRDRDPGIVSLIEAFVRPDIEVLLRLHERGPVVAHFLGRLYLDQTPWIREMAQEQFAPVATRYFPHLARAVPHLTESVLVLRMARFGVVLAHAFATWPADGLSEERAESMLRELVAFGAGAVSAPLEVDLA